MNQFQTALTILMQELNEEKLITPGGRVGSDASTGSSANGENWVERTPGGHLPKYVRTVRNGLMREGMSEGKATAMAVAAMKRWARGGDNVRPQVQAAAAAALAEWNAMKASKWIGDYCEVSDFVGGGLAEFKAAPKLTEQERREFNDKHPRGGTGTSAGGKFVKKNTTSPKASNKPGSKPGGKAGGKAKVYKIKKGDTLSALAKKFGVTVAQFMKANPKIKDRDLIIAGQALLIPGTGSKSGKGGKGGKGSGSKDPSDRPFVDLGDVSRAEWDRLMKQGWKGRRGDHHERLYPPPKKAGSGSGGGKGGSGGSSGSGGSGGHSGGSGGGSKPKPQGNDNGEAIRKIEQQIAKLRKRLVDLRSEKKTLDQDSVDDADIINVELRSLLNDLDAFEQKEANMSVMEYKEVGVLGQEVLDEEKGVVKTYVSITGLTDNVKDVIHPGSYEKSLATRTPKGVWSHSWDTPVSKTLDVKELMPGDPELPETLPNKEPWPSNAGALLVKTQFNLETQRGREAYSDVVFFGDQQEWSIGYQVPTGGATVDSKTGIRHINHLELYEYSPVLFGAMPAARTSSVKDAQTAFKQITMPVAEFKSWCGEVGVEFKSVSTNESTSEEGEPNEEETPESGVGVASVELAPNEPDDARLYEEDEEQEGVEFVDTERADFIKSIVLETLAAAGIHPQHKSDDAAAEGDTESESGGPICSAVSKHKEALGDNYEKFRKEAELLDTAIDAEDEDGIDKHGDAILSTIESDEEADGDLLSAYKAIASAVAKAAEGTDAPSEDSSEKKQFPPRPDDLIFQFEDEEEDTESKSELVKLELKDLDALRIL